MHKFFVIVLIIVFCLAGELVCLQLLGPFFVPDFILIAVVFFNLFRGLRPSLGAAFFGGGLVDSYSGNLIGIHIFSFVVCAGLTAALKKYLYQPGVPESRVFMVVLVCGANGLLQGLAYVLTGVEFNFADGVLLVMFPKICITALAATFTFERIKQCVLRLSA